MNTFVKNLFTALCIITLGIGAYAATPQEARQFFDKYVNATNTYSTEVPNFYSPTAKIIRQVVKPDGSLVDVPFTMEQYRTQMKLSSATAKMRKYTNAYSDIKIKTIDTNTYQIDAKRQPSTGGDKLKTSTTVQKQKDGKWLITKEVMQTKEQIFLKYAKK